MEEATGFAAELSSFFILIPLLWPYFRFFPAAIALPQSNPRPFGVDRELCYRFQRPSVQCSDHSRLPAPGVFVAGALHRIRRAFPALDAQRRMAEGFLSRFCVRGEYAVQVLDTLANQLFIGIECNKMWNRPPHFLSSQMAMFHRKMYPEYRKKYRLINPGSTEVFCFHHGLRLLPARLRARVRERSIIDVGAFNGDSALVLSQYGKDVYSIEMSAENFAQMNKVLAANPNYSANVHTVHAGVWSQSLNTVTPGGGGAGASLNVGKGHTHMQLITIDDFVRSHGITLGFIKADVEGVGYHVVKGAIKSIKRDRPVVSISCYHSFSEMDNVSALLMQELDDYVFEWHMENGVTWAWFELSFFAYPRDI